MTTQKPLRQLKKFRLVLLVILLIGGSVVAGVLVVKKLNNNSSNPTVVGSNQSRSNERSHKPVVDEKKTPEDSNQSAPKSESKTDQKSATKPDSKANDQKAPGHKTKPGSKPASGSGSTPTATPNTPKPNPTKPDAPKPSPTPQPQPAPTPQPQPQPVDQLNQLRRQIEARYGVKVFYTAGEVQAYRPQGRVVTPLSDDKAKAALNEINQVLGKYPAGFFQEFKNNNMQLSFYLIWAVANDAFNGLADTQFMNNPKITLTYKNILFSMTANHEIMHAIDSFMEIKVYPATPYSEHFKLNPPGFVYGADNDQYVLFHDNQPYFTTAYGKTNVREDRAEVFRFMMRDYNTGDWFKHPHLNQKAWLIARQIDANFHSADLQAYWMRFLK